MRIEAASFDVGGTLVDVWPSVGAVYREVALESGLEVPPAGVLDTAFRRAWRAVQPFDHSVDGWRRIVDRTFGGSLTRPEMDHLFPHLFERFAEGRSYRVHDDVVPGLERLRRSGFRLIIVSNWDRRLHRLVDEWGLREYFGCVVASADHGWHKPDRRLFEQAAALLGVAPAGVAHVGDQWIEDVEGPRAAGGRGWLLDRSGAGAGRPEVVGNLGQFADRLLTERQSMGREGCPVEPVIV